jgi:hypothetical protein
MGHSPVRASGSLGLPDAAVRFRRSLQWLSIGFDCNAGPTVDPRVREAIDHLVGLD